MTAETITEAMQQAASEAYDAFARIKRGEESIITLRDDAPDWVQDAVRSAHHDFLPDDWRYEKIRHAFGAIADAAEGSDLMEVGDEFRDGAVDVYTAGRLQWLVSNLNRPSYCDEARDEGLIGDDADLIERVGMGQYIEAGEVWGEVLNAVEERVSTEEDDDGEPAR